MFIMYRLSFPLKFALVSALFAVPLTITGVQTILDRQSEIDSAEYKQTGINKISAFHSIISELENLRDLSVSQRGHDNKTIDKYFWKSLKKLRVELKDFIQNKNFNHKKSILLIAKDLQKSLSEFKPSTGSEGDSAYNIFGSVNFFVDNAYTLQSEIANEHGLLSDKAALEAHLTSLLVNDFQQSMEIMGQARAYGTYFINAGVIGSRGILLLEQTFLKLGSIEKRLQQGFKSLYLFHDNTRYKQKVNPQLLNNMTTIANLIEDNLLLDPDMATPWQEYYQQANRSIDNVNELQLQIIQFLSSQYQSRYLNLKYERTLYFLAIGSLVGLFIYLFVGLFLSFRSSIKGLSQAAMHVADGALDEHFNVEPYDEIGKLAKVFDTMRSQLKERHQQLIDQAITDGLTGVYNRKHFNDKLSELITLSRRINKPVTLLLIDIDHFKKLNDHYGHQAGDHCLQVVAQFLEKGLVRSTDDLYRYGGEEFTVLLPDTSLAGGIKVAELLCDGIRNLPLEFESQTIKTSISIGVACTEHINEFNDDNLVSLADAALYKAKEKGRDQVVSAHGIS